MLLTLYSVLINKCGKRKKEPHYDMVLDVWHIASGCIVLWTILRILAYFQNKPGPQKSTPHDDSLTKALALTFSDRQI
jgi:hypothetical protein